MSWSSKSTPLWPTKTVPLSGKNMTKVATLDISPARSRRVSTDPRLDSRFPKLVFSKKSSRSSNGLVNLDTRSERKYRSWSDPTGQYIGDTNVHYRHTEKASFGNDDSNTTWAILPRLGREVTCTKRESFDDKSFCDSVSSFPCSSLSRSSTTCSPVVDDERFVSISKCKTVANWIQSIRRTREFVNK